MGNTEIKSQPVLDTSKFRIRHTMLRVFDLDRSLDFYTRLMGMRLLRKRDTPAGKYTNAFVGYVDEAAGAVLELTYNWAPKEPYTLGTGFGHVAINVPDVYAVCEALAKEGVKIPRPPGPIKFGTHILAYIEDPDGYKIELTQHA